MDEKYSDLRKSILKAVKIYLGKYNVDDELFDAICGLFHKQTAKKKIMRIAHGKHFVDYASLLNIEKLPIDPKVAFELYMEIEQGHDFEILLPIIKRDQVLYGKVKKLLASAYYSGTNKNAAVEEIQPRHLVRLGNEKIRELAMLNMYHMEDFDSEMFDYKSFCDLALLRAIAARELVDTGIIENCVFRSGHLYIAGLMSRIGQMAFAWHMGKDYDQVLRTNQDWNNPKMLAAAERTAFGIDHAEISYRMMLQCKFSLSLSLLVKNQYNENINSVRADNVLTHRYFNDMEDGCFVLKCADILVSHIAGQNEKKSTYIESIESEARNKYNLEIEEILACEEIVRQEWEGMKSLILAV